MKRCALVIAMLVGAQLGAACGADPDDGAESRGDAAAEVSTAAADEGAARPASETADETAAEPGYRRIISLSPTGTEILFAIGAGDRVVAVDEFSDYPPEAPTTDLSGWNPNVEAIAGYEPDLVVLQTNGELIASLEALGIGVLAHDAASSLSDVYDQISHFGEVLGHSAEAAALVDRMRSEIAALIEAAPDASGLTYFHELDNTLYSVTSATFVGHIYSLFGLQNVADPADADGAAFGYPQLSDEYLIEADPDVIFLADTLCCSQSAQTVAQRPGWNQLSAVQSGRVVELNDDVVSRWGPRLVDFVAAVSEVLAGIGAAR